MNDVTLAPPEAPAPAFEHEVEYQRVLARMRKRRSGWWTALLLVGSLAAFLVVQQRESGTLLSLGVLTGVLFLHESGHWLGMRLLGWRDLQMFFIPFFGAAVSGRRAGAEAWKEGVVLLLGPLPGLVLGFGLALALRTEGSAGLQTAAAMLLAVNAFNLVPLAVLDGGKVLQLTLFQRHRSLEVAFLGLASVGMVAASIALPDRLLTYVGIATLVSLPLRQRLLQGADTLRRSGLSLPVDARELEGDTGRAVFRVAWSSLQGRQRSDAGLAGTIESLVELVSRRVPSGAQSAGLLLGWAAGLALGGGGLWLLRHPSLSWREVGDPAHHYRVQVPWTPRVADHPAADGTLATHTLNASSGDYAFLVVEADLPDDEEIDLAAWGDSSVPGLVKDFGARVVRNGPGAYLGHPSFDAALATDRNDIRVIGFVHAQRRYLLVAAAPTQDPALDRFLTSLAFLEPPVP